MSKPADSESIWAARWLDGVASSPASMSQRRLTSIERYGGGLEAVAAAATARGVHLLLLTDDKGDRLVAASRHPFTVVC